MALLEVAGRPFGARGVVSSMRPKRYYTIPRDSVEKLFNELHDLSNFFVLEFQRVVFVENIFATIVVGFLLLLASTYCMFTNYIFRLLSPHLLDTSLSSIFRSGHFCS